MLCSTYSWHNSGDNLNLSSLNVRSFTSRIVFSVRMRLVYFVSDNILSKLVTTSGVGVLRTALISSWEMNIFASVKSLQKLAIFRIKSLFLVRSEYRIWYKVELQSIFLNFSGSSPLCLSLLTNLEGPSSQSVYIRPLKLNFSGSFWSAILLAFFVILLQQLALGALFNSWQDS